MLRSRPMRRLLVGACTLIAVGACDKKGDTEEVARERALPQEPSSTTPLEPVAMGATDFCKLLYEAPTRALDKACGDPDKKTSRYAAVVEKTRERVQACWSMLNPGIQAKRLTLPALAAKRCAAALEKLPWTQSLAGPITQVSECRNIAIGLATAGKPCRATYECGPGLFCAGGTSDADGTCTKKIAAGERCELPAWNLLGENEAACEAGLFCDHGGRRAALVEPPPENRFGVPQPANPWGSPDLLDPFAVPEPRKKPPRVKVGKTTVTGRLPPEVIQRIVRSNFGRFRVCYEAGLRTNPNLSGKVTVRFVISRTGTVSSVASTAELPDSAVVSCVERAFYSLTFPQPEGGIVSVSYPIVFSPDDRPPAPSTDGDEAPPTPSLGTPTSTCMARRKVTESCRASRECDAKLACVMGKCGQPLAEGETCQVADDCAEGLGCFVEAPSAEETKGEGEEGEAPPAPVVRTCKKKKAANEACASDDECLGACVAAKCAPFCGAG